MFPTIGSKERLVSRVSSEIERAITEGQLAPGMRLPTQTELAEQLGVSRTVIREAVHVLVTKGLLETKPGVGMTVREVNQKQITQPLSLLLKTHDPDQAIANLYQVRVILEVANAEIAAEKITDEEIAELTQRFRDLEAARSTAETYVEKDVAFHRAIASASHNILLTTLLDSISDLLHEVLVLVNTNDDIVEHTAWSIPYHRRILECIVQHDRAAARAAMIEHLRTGHAHQESILAKLRAMSGGQVPTLVSSNALERRTVAPDIPVPQPHL